MAAAGVLGRYVRDTYARADLVAIMGDRWDGDHGK
jgi:hypothetical protein